MVKPGYKMTEVGEIPVDWEVKTLPEVVDFIHGKAHERHIDSGGKYVVVNSKFISSDGEVKKFSAENFCPAKIGDVLTVLSDLPNGKALAKCYLVKQNDKYAVNQRVCIYRPKASDSGYVNYVLNRNKYFLKFDDGVTQTHILNHHIRECPIPLPPTLAEQTAIATALSDADGLIRGLEAVIAKKRAIKEGVMGELLRPKAGWVETTLGEVAQIEMGQSPSSLFYNKVGQGLPLIQGNADIENRRSIIRNYTTSITKEGKKGDILMSVRAPVGEISKLEFDACLGRGVCAIRSGNDFLYHYLVSLESSWARIASGSTFTSVNSIEVRNLEVNMPGEKEQIEIAKILSTLDAELTLLTTKLAKARQLKAGMMGDLLTGRVRLV